MTELILADPEVSDTTPGATFPEFAGDTIRERLINALKVDILGPESPEEELNQSPATRYPVGMLAPRNTRPDPLEDESMEAAADDETADDATPPVSLSLAPSSIGLSFVVPRNSTNVVVEASWGEYTKHEADDEVPTELATDIDRDDDPDETANRKKRKQYRWRRTPHTGTVTITGLEEGRAAPVVVGDGAHIEWMARFVGDSAVVSVFLVNIREAPSGRRPPDEDWLYQPRLRIHASGVEVFEPRQLAASDLLDVSAADPDIASANLVYRKRVEFATGHGVAASWTLSSRWDRAVELSTEIVPQREVPIVKPFIPQDFEEPDMERLAACPSGDDVIALLQPLLDSYEDWIEDRRKESESIQPDGLRKVAGDHVTLMNTSLRRMQQGLDLIGSRDDVFRAFTFANLAMAKQRQASVRVLRRRRGQTVTEDVAKKWRPFQIGFILQSLAGIVDPAAPDRELVDLLWFPTGGGKTEAYLGLTAFTLAFRRIRLQYDQFDYAGMSVLMRYTLRLLTIQQFQRATALICACESIRLENEEQWGVLPFTIGLWVGRDVTPNDYATAKEALALLKRDEQVYSSSPYQVVFCPWCGTDITPNDYRSDDDLERTFVHCSNRECLFAAGVSECGIPVLVVDHEIYRNPPSLLVSTVDKFAQMAWNGSIQSLFGRVSEVCPRHGYISAGENHPSQHHETKGWPKAVVRPVERWLAPPDLIIQDELHLISGPLGTLVGIYESVVDDLCRTTVGDALVGPKVIASTATIRRSKQQVRALFNRSVSVFPPQGLDASDSFFAKESTDVPGRLYVGVFGPGKSIKTNLVRVYAALLSRAEEEFTQAPSPESDAYMTLVAYFNSIRELGGALRLVEDDVVARMRVLRRRRFGPTRILYEKPELTSRMRSTQIADTLKKLERTFLEGRKSSQYPIDVLLASNMLSVGVDIDRLGLMVVSGQPKTTAEYIQATSRVGRVHPGLVVEVYNWVRPRDTSHYERFEHYHDTFYRHVEATSATPFSARARDRALPGVLVSYARMSDPSLSQESGANHLDPADSQIERMIADLSDRAFDITERDDVRQDTETQLRNLLSEWSLAKSPPSSRPLVYSRRGASRKTPDANTILMRQMEESGGQGLWRVAGSLREVETEVDIVLSDGPPE